MSGNMVDVKIKIPAKGRFKGDNILQRQLTFDIISDWIRVQGFDEYTTNGLIELASKYPTQALPSFRRNFNLMVARVRGKRKLEQRGIDENANSSNINEKEERIEKTGKGYQSIKLGEVKQIEIITPSEDQVTAFE